MQVIECRLYKREERPLLSFYTKEGKSLKVTDVVTQFARPVVEANGCRLWDVEYVREGTERYLRLYIDKDGGVDIEDCEKIHRAVDPILDEQDPISESYHFEVCSAGLERPLKRPADFEQFMGSAVTVKLYRPRNGLKEIPGVLCGYEEGKVTVQAGKETITFEKSEVALVRLRVEF
ncbi:MAG: ribosome maturation factor RimP [Oscillospiraceae bacterium]|nr:ribosome maturation factor RimP [Oscillospiraceae bacterium]